MTPPSHHNTRLETPLCPLLGIRYPIIQAPIGSASCPELAAAVSNAGGLGMLGLSWQNTENIRTLIRETQALTDAPFGVNFVMAEAVISKRPLDERLAICLAEKVPFISLSWGVLTRDLVDSIHEAGSILAYTVWDVQQALEVAALGVDCLVVQGAQAGGHLNSTMDTFALVSDIQKQLPAVPLIAAGGIGNGRDITQALQAGASGVWMGTRFVASTESLAHEDYKQKIVSANGEDTVLNTLYQVGWPEAPHRTIRNSTSRQWEDRGCPELASSSDRDEIVAYFSDGTPVRRYEDVIPLQGMTGDLEPLAHYAGTSASGIHEIHPAKTIVEMLVREAQGDESPAIQPD